MHRAPGKVNPSWSFPPTQDVNHVPLPSHYDQLTWSSKFSEHTALRARQSQSWVGVQNAAAQQGHASSRSSGAANDGSSHLAMLRWASPPNQPHLACTRGKMRAPRPQTSTMRQRRHSLPPQKLHTERDATVSVLLSTRFMWRPSLHGRARVFATAATLLGTRSGLGSQTRWPHRRPTGGPAPLTAARCLFARELAPAAYRHPSTASTPCETSNLPSNDLNELQPKSQPPRPHHAATNNLQRCQSTTAEISHGGRKAPSLRHKTVVCLFPCTGPTATFQKRCDYRRNCTPSPTVSTCFKEARKSKNTVACVWPYRSVLITVRNSAWID